VTPAFRDALALTLEHEGGFSNHPLDRGGRTYRGVTQKTYDHFRRTIGQVMRPVEQSDEWEIDRIYFDDYWVPCNCDALPVRLGQVVFDMAVNSGGWNAKLALQEALRVRGDGVIGPKTVAAAHAEPEAVRLFLEKRMAFIQDLISASPSQVAFLEGWGVRLIRQAWRTA
jgi:lysozyme family protein